MLRIGLLLDGYEVDAWESRMFQEITECSYAEIVLVVRNASPRASHNPRLIDKLTRNFGRITTLAVNKALTTVYEKVIDRTTYLPDATVKVSCEELLKDVTTIEVVPRSTKYSDYLLAQDVEKIREERIDVLVRSGFGILRGEVLESARYGIWSFHHGDSRRNRGGPPGFWESMEGWPTTGSVLQVLTEDLDNGEVIHRSMSRTDPVSLRDSRSNYYWKSLTFMTRALKELHDLGGDAFMDRVGHDNRHPEFYSDRLYRYPTNRELARIVGRKLWAKARWHVRSWRHFDQWGLMFHMSEEWSTSLWRYAKIFPPKDRFWADPNVIFESDRYYIFIEEFPFREGKGRVAVITMEADGTYTEPQVVLDRPYHLSYPFVFKVDEQYYMIPETVENHTIELYRCVRFPDRWELEMNLMEGVGAIDTTVLRHAGKWWLFTNIAAIPGASGDDELHVFYSNELLTQDWRPHARNPVVSDCRRARSAGRFFRVGDRLYRPSQNCSNRYGYGFNIGEVTTLSETEFAEEVVSQVEPNWDAMVEGTHTFSRAGNLHVIDAEFRRRR